MASLGESPGEMDLAEANLCQDGDARGPCHPEGDHQGESKHADHPPSMALHEGAIAQEPECRSGLCAAEGKASLRPVSVLFLAQGQRSLDRVRKPVHMGDEGIEFISP